MNDLVDHVFNLRGGGRGGGVCSLCLVGGGGVNELACAHFQASLLTHFDPKQAKTKQQQQTKSAARHISRAARVLVVPTSWDQV